MVMGLSVTLAALAVAAAGVLSDLFGQRRVLLVFLGVGTAGFLVVSYLAYRGASPFLAAAFFTMGAPAGYAVRSFANVQAGGITDGASRNRVFAFLYIGLNIGFILGNMLSSYLVGVSYAHLYVVSCAAYLIVGVLTALFFTEPAHSQGHRAPWREGVSALVRDRTFLLFCGLTFAAYAVFAQFGVTFSIYVVERISVSKPQLGYLFALNGIWIVLFQYPALFLSGRLRPETGLALGMLIISCGFFSVAFARSFWSLAASTVILTVGETVLVPALMSTVTRLAATSERGTYMALLFALQILGLGVAPLLGGFLLSVFSGITALLWLVVGLAGLLCVLGYYALGRVRRTVHT
jgi:MFS family permease